MQPFIPDPHSPRAFREALGRYATGVTVVTTLTESGPLAITANSFASVSLDPPLVLWCPARGSSRFAAFHAAERYTIHILAAGQRDHALRFARSGDDFDGLELHQDAQGFVRLPEVLACFDCTAHARFEAGDHAILVGRVVAAAQRDGDPLVFWGGRWGDFLHHG